MQLTFLGSGGAQQVPVFGCDCVVCERARLQPEFRRLPCSAQIIYDGELTLIDAGLHQLAEIFRAGQIQRFLLTHYHMDHVQGLFPLRWGMGQTIPVFGPPDNQGCDDLFKHPGILDFQPPFQALVPQQVGALLVTPIPLNHSKVTYGYLIQHPSDHHDRSVSLAYLTDTAGLPDVSKAFLQSVSLDLLVLDCSHPPRSKPDRNHNDIHQALEIHRQLVPKQTLLTHVSHLLDAWLMDNHLPEGVDVARDNMVITL